MTMVTPDRYAVDDHVVRDFIRDIAASEVTEATRQRMYAACDRSRQAQEAEYRRMGHLPYAPMWHRFRTWIHSERDLIGAVDNAGRVPMAEMNEFAKEHGYPNGGWRGFIMSDHNLGCLQEVDGWCQVSMMSAVDRELYELLKPYVPVAEQT